MINASSSASRIIMTEVTGVSQTQSIPHRHRGRPRIRQRRVDLHAARRCPERNASGIADIGLVVEFTHETSTRPQRTRLVIVSASAQSDKRDLNAPRGGAATEWRYDRDHRQTRPDSTSSAPSSAHR
jgi:hypothetical protein